jgi:ribonuclease P protein component
MNHRAEFAQVRGQGKSRPGRYLVVSTLTSEELSHFKTGFITTKKVGKAHQRNYLRRVFRSIVQNHGENLRDDSYIVTIARWRAAEASYEELEKEWLKLARKLGVLKSVE